MITRTSYLETMAKRLESYAIVSLPGPRQSGKTTLARQFTKNHWNGPIHIFDLESPRDQAKLANPEMVLKSLEGLIILDEIQQKPELFEVLRVLADRPNNPAKFLILGSASPELIKGVSESLAGRVSFIDITGFTLEELGSENLQKRWQRGGFPDAFLAPDDERAFQWHEDFFRTFLERDIPRLGITVPANTLLRFWTMVAHYHGQTWNAAEFARALGESEKIARKFLDILCGTYMVRQLTPWHENLKKRQVKSPKIYVRDSGICHALFGLEDFESLNGHPKIGASWEGFCIEQIISVVGSRKAFYWSTHSGAEVDLLLFHKGKRLGFEFKYNEAPRTQKSMHIAIEDLSLDHLYVVNPGKDTFPMKENITAMSLPSALALLAK